MVPALDDVPGVLVTVELPPAAAMPEPLWRWGRHRRPGPSAWGYDPYAPDLLDPAEVVAFNKCPPTPILRTMGHWSDRRVWEARRFEHPELRLWQRPVMAALVPDADPVRKMLLVEPKNEKRKPKGDWRSWLHAACFAIAQRAELHVRGLCGQWIGHRFVRFLSRREWAAIIGCSVPQFKRILNVLKAAKYIKRRSRYDKDPTTGEYAGRVASLLVTETFWRESGVWGERLAHLASAAGLKRKEERKADKQNRRAERTRQATERRALETVAGPLAQRAAQGKYDPAALAQAEDRMAAARRLMDAGMSGAEAIEAVRRRQRDKPPP